MHRKFPSEALVKHCRQKQCLKQPCTTVRNASSPTQSNKEHAEIEALQAKEADEIALKLQMKQEEERVQAEEAARAAEAQTQADSNTVVTEVAWFVSSCAYLTAPRSSQPLPRRLIPR